MKTEKSPENHPKPRGRCPFPGPHIPPHISGPGTSSVSTSQARCAKPLSAFKPGVFLSHLSFLEIEHLLVPGLMITFVCFFLTLLISEPTKPSPKGHWSGRNSAARASSEKHVQWISFLQSPIATRRLPALHRGDLRAQECSTGREERSSLRALPGTGLLPLLSLWALCTGSSKMRRAASS